MKDFFDLGYARFPMDPALQDWAEKARLAALSAMQDPDHLQQWMQCQDTWFVGVDTLPNDPSGSVENSASLSGQAFEFIEITYGKLPLHRGQVSVIYPGYPKPRNGESETAFGYRLRRDAAHVDGFLANDQKRRHLIERHAYILGLPLNDCSIDASPLVVWENSHKIIRAALEQAYGDIPQDQWHDIDITDIYQTARRMVFETCKRIELPARPGEATLVHRHTLHGVASWAATAIAPKEGRMIAYFRPEFPAGTTDWLTAP